MTGQHQQFLAGGDVSDQDRVGLVSGGKRPAVGSERDAPRHGGRPLEGPPRDSPGDVPEGDDAVLVGRRQAPAIRCEGYRRDDEPDGISRTSRPQAGSQSRMVQSMLAEASSVPSEPKGRLFTLPR